MRNTSNHQALIEVRTMGSEDVLAMEQAAKKGKCRVKDEGPDKQHTDKGKARIVLTCNNGQYSESIT